MNSASKTPAYIRFIPALFTFTIFLSASLLFFVQPLFAKIVLPHIGGGACCMDHSNVILSNSIDSRVSLCTFIDKIHASAVSDIDPYRLLDIGTVALAVGHSRRLGL